jgi:pimeloyl-ACP methyl ester carboxylesterase
MNDQARREEVRFRSGDLTLAGTFTLPPADGPVPAVLMLQGSGRTDRDDNAKALALDIFPQLSAAIVREGFATFRYDKRGVGGSEGDYFGSDLDDLLTDAVAAVAWLRARPEVDASRVIALGHSEGAMLSARLAAGAAPGTGEVQLAGAVLLAGAAVTGEQILTWQGRQIAQSLTGVGKWVARLARIDIVKSQRKALNRIRISRGAVVRVRGRKINAAWMRQFMAYDPAPELARIEVPVLAVTGDRDLQVDPDDLDVMRDLVKGPFQALRLSGVTHLLRAEGSKRGLSGYKEQARRPVDPRVISAVTGWLADNAAGTAPPLRAE